MNSFISSNDHWFIWTSLVSIAALSLYLEQKYQIFQKITGAVVAMIVGMILSNIGFLPTESASYDVVWEYVQAYDNAFAVLIEETQRFDKGYFNVRDWNCNNQ